MREILRLDSEYPTALRGLTDAPSKIFLKGKIIDADEKAIAIVGTRTPTEYGKEVAYKFAYELANSGFTIISGLARGIDTIAHKAALKAGGRTIAVLGNGLDVIYPPENKKLYQQISESGALLSEFPPGSRPLPKNFLARNRIISGLAQAVLVIEGRRRSGTISTATHAAGQGKDVFAIPGQINSSLSEAPNYLIQNGAAIAKSPQDIIDILG